MKKILKLVGFAFFCRSFFITDLSHIPSLISGFSAKSIASGHFIDQRSKETIEKGTMILI
jgi:hypothetical protein